MRPEHTLSRDSEWENGYAGSFSLSTIAISGGSFVSIENAALFHAFTCTLPLTVYFQWFIPQRQIPQIGLLAAVTVCGCIRIICVSS